MPRHTTFAALDQILASFLNAFQDETILLSDVSLVGGNSIYSTDGSDIKISPIKFFVGSHVVYTTSGESTYTPSMSADTLYYLYCYINAGAIAFESSTTAPDAHLVFKTGDTSRRYLCFFRSTSSNEVPHFRMVNGHYRYELGIDQRILGAGTATTFTNTDLKPDSGGSAKFVPSWVRHVTLRAAGTNDDTVQGRYVKFLPDSGSSASSVEVPVPVKVGVNGRAEQEFAIECNSSQQVAYRVEQGGVSLLLWLTGCHEALKY